MSIKLKPLSEQVLVVTGATSGNGLAVAEQAVKHGAAVVAVARNEAALDELKTRLAADARDVGCIAAQAPGTDTRSPTASVRSYRRLWRISPRAEKIG